MAAMESKVKINEGAGWNLGQPILGDDKYKEMQYLKHYDTLWKIQRHVGIQRNMLSNIYYIKLKNNNKSKLWISIN